jgi:ABC-type ATPase with predicted acetyltransferase domain
MLVSFSADSSTLLTAGKKFDWNLPVTEKTANVFKAFGITVQTLKNNIITHRCQIKLSAGDICYITGPSGSGKSVLLREFYDSLSGSEKININDIPLPDDKTCIDCISPPAAQSGNGTEFIETLRTLSSAGLGDVLCVLNSPANLSDGQKYRYRIAKALSGERKFIFADEFCSSLDRTAAAVVCVNLRKLAKESGKTFILASSHDDILADLLPDVIVIKHLAGDAEVIYKNQK